MAEFANILYKQFFLRDLLGKIVPGAIVFLALYSIIPKETVSVVSMPDSLDWLLGLVLFASFMLFGICVQTIGELSGLHSAHPRPLIAFLQNEKGVKARNLFRERQARFGKEANDSQKEQRERYVYLKEGTGNFALALFISAFAVWGQWQLMILMVLISVLAYFTHMMSRSRQGYYEMKVLGLMPKAGEKNEQETRYIQEDIDKYIGREL